MHDMDFISILQNKINCQVSLKKTGDSWYIYNHIFDIFLCRRFDETGNTIGKPEVTPPTPTRLTWELKFEAEEAIQRSLNVADALINDIDLRIFVHDSYGKGNFFLLFIIFYKTVF